MNIGLIKKSLAFVKSVFEDNDTQKLHYHNHEHTVKVYSHAKEISDSYASLSQNEKLCIQLAAIFHDVAYYKGGQNHEENSVSLAKEFLTKEGLDKSQISLIEQLILATHRNHKPLDLLEKIIKDSDLSHLGCETYMDDSYINLLAEINEYSNKPISNENWRSMCVDFFENQKYYTTYAQEHYTKQKEINLEKIKKMNEPSDTSKSEEIKLAAKKLKKSSKKGKSKRPEKGIETMFRVSLRNHLSLSRIADNKANTLISVNAIIISIVLSTMFPKMDSNPYLIYPGVALLVFSIFTIIIATLSTIPKTTLGSVSRKEVEEKKGNLIFFGNFHNMSLNDFEWGISELMKDKDYLYNTLSRDLYYLGKVLNRKYVLLRYSYYTFVIGLSTSIILFLLSLKDIMV